MQISKSLLVMVLGFSVHKKHHRHSHSGFGSLNQPINFSAKLQHFEMLGSLGTSHEEGEEEESEQLQQPYHHFHPHPHHHHQHLRPQIPAHGLSSAAHQMRQVLINCAEFISQSDFPAARRIISVLTSNSSPYGDSTERLIHQFTKALSIRLNRNTCWNFIAAAAAAGIPVPDVDPGILQSSYLSLNQITPFIRFSHLTANQAILEAIEGQQSIHILDFNTMQGVQWPPLMQAIAERSEQTSPRIRITGTGSDLSTLTRTGERLQKFAQSLNLNFQFQPLQLHEDSSPTTLLEAIEIQPQDAFAVNCVLHLHKLIRDDAHDLRLFLRAIKSMNPKVVTLAEKEANHNQPLFLQRFMEALDHYSAIFESLEATLPPNSQERLSVEQVWLGKEIANIVSAEGDERKERHGRFQSWVEIMRSTGFTNVPLSPFALSQARLLLRLHYPSEGYQLQLLNDSFFLGWQNQTLFSVSSWH